MSMRSDSLSFNISELRTDVKEMQFLTDELRRSQKEFLTYIDGDLQLNWNTPGGKMALDKLRDFVNGDFQKYIQYLDRKVQDFENDIIPALDRINNA